MEHPMHRTRRIQNELATTDVAAIVLAGGRGERLGPLTAECAKPAVPFGSSYRVIDFSLSNCLNSGIHRIGVATQYQARSIASHVRRAWNLPRRTRHGIELWDAARFAPGGQYTGTADAVFRNLANLRTHRPRLLLVLAGDHIYQMDYRPMIAAHVASGAAATVACIEAPLAEASRYGVLGTDANFRIDSFAEKPTHPVPTSRRPDRALVSMGIYLFDFETIARELLVDALTESSTHDFGHDVIPRLIASHHVHAYSFHDAAGEPCFWRDVGTPDAYHATSMALLDPTSGFDPERSDWPIHSGGSPNGAVRFRSQAVRRRDEAATALADVSPITLEGVAVRSTIGSGCLIAGGIVSHSVLAENVVVYSGALVQDCVVLPGAEIGERASIRNAIVAAGCRIPPDTRIGIEGVEDTVACECTAGGIRIVTQDAVDRALVPGRPSAAVESAPSLVAAG
jgi:glucose-1-phosphate adenylyltransferase